TNEGAPMGRVMRVDPRHLERRAWKENVAESSAKLDNIQVIGGRLILSYLRDVHSDLEVHALDGRLERLVELPPFVTASIDGRADEDTAYVYYSSFLEPSTILQTSIARGTTSVWERVKVPFDASKYQVDQVRYPSRDGTQIPMFLLHRKDAPRDGS